MSRRKDGNNFYEEKIIDGKECVVFQTVGKEVHSVIVDKKCWYEYLKCYSWTAIKNGSRINVKTSIDKQSNSLWRVIVEHEYDELDWWGATVDHINNNPLDNRICNLRLYNAAILNSSNVSSKYERMECNTFIETETRIIQVDLKFIIIWREGHFIRTLEFLNMEV